jgi:hypothetical protein
VIPLKWIERRREYLADRKRWFDDLLEAGRTMNGRRRFLQMSAMAAGVAAAKGLAPHSFQLVDVVNAQSKPNLTFAYLSDSHLYEKEVNEDFVRQLERDCRCQRTEPQPDFVFYGGDLVQFGQPSEFNSSPAARDDQGALKIMVGEHDWFSIWVMWKSFGPFYYSSDGAASIS